MLKGSLQSELLKQYMVTIGADHLLSISELYKHRYLETIKKLYRSTGKFDDKQNYKSIIEASIIPTPEGFNDNNTLSPGSSVTVKNPSARKSLRQFTEVFGVK